MTTQYDYEALLQSMSALTQSNQGQPRHAARTQNPAYTRHGRIEKPSSNKSSPQPMPRRRTTPSSHSARDHHAHNTLRQSRSRGQLAVQRARPPVNGMVFDDRPFSWHPGVESTFVSPSRHNADNFAAWNAPSSGFGHQQPDVWPLLNTQLPQEQQMFHQSAWTARTNNDPNTSATWFDSSPFETPPQPVANPQMQALANAHLSSFPLDRSNLVINTSTEGFSSANPTASANNNLYTFFQPNLFPSKQHSPSLPSPSHNQELVGMGLYDDDKSSEDPEPRSLLLEAGLSDTTLSSSPGKGLKLEETFQPPDEVPEAVRDEGADTPATGDFPAWPSSSGLTPSHTKGIDVDGMPMSFLENSTPSNVTPYGTSMDLQRFQNGYGDMDGQTFFLEDGDMNAWGNGGKEPYMGNELGLWDWSSMPQDGFWTT